MSGILTAGIASARIPDNRGSRDERWAGLILQQKDAVCLCRGEGRIQARPMVSVFLTLPADRPSLLMSNT